MTTNTTMIQKLRKVTLTDPDDERERLVLTTRWSFTGTLNEQQWKRVRVLYRPWSGERDKSMDRDDMAILRNSPL